MIRHRYRSGCATPLANQNEQGFTLVELSIVLVIIGTIIGAILVGRDLIHAAELRALISEEEKIVSAINTFKLTYNCIPGDCANATDYFGQAADCSSATSLPETGTCNGNGDGVITTAEDFLAAHHLHIAHLVSLPLTTPFNRSVTYLGQIVYRPGGNTLGSNALSGLGWNLLSIPSARIGTSGNPWFCGAYPSNKNELFFGGASINMLGTFNSVPPGNVAIASNDAISIDSKIDDGKPATGFVVLPYYAHGYDLATFGTDNACDALYPSTATYIRNVFGGRGGLVFMTNF